MDAGNTFTPLGQFFSLGMLIQIGGLGVTAMGTGIIIAMRKRLNFKGRVLVQEAMNLDSRQGIVRFVKSIFITTIIFELAGALLSFTVFCKGLSAPEGGGHQPVSFCGCFQQLGL